MELELIAQLYTLGFPVKDYTGHGPVVILGDNQGSFALPTLSELIEACGDKFILLERLKNGWECVPCDKFGKTPEEAVANLWLQLNKKL